MGTPRQTDRSGAAEAATVRLWLRLLGTAHAVESRLRARLQGEFATTMPRFDAMAQLARVPEGMTMSALSQRMMVTKGNITGLIERMAAEGLVERTLDPRDRRATIVRLSASGRHRFAAVAPVMRTWILEELAGLEEDDIDQLYRLLGRIRAAEGTGFQETEEDTP